MAAVTPAWKAMEKAVHELRPTAESTLKEKLTPLFDAQNEIMEKMKDGVMSIIDPLLKEKVSPHISKIVEIIQSPVCY